MPRIPNAYFGAIKKKKVSGTNVALHYQTSLAATRVKEQPATPAARSTYCYTALVTSSLPSKNAVSTKWLLNYTSLGY